MILINYHNLIPVGKMNLIINIRLIYIFLLGVKRDIEVTKYFSNKRENREKRKQEDFLSFVECSIKVLK